MPVNNEKLSSFHCVVQKHITVDLHPPKHKFLYFFLLHQSYEVDFRQFCFFSRWGVGVVFQDTQRSIPELMPSTTLLFLRHKNDTHASIQSKQSCLGLKEVFPEFPRHLMPSLHFCQSVRRRIHGSLRVTGARLPLTPFFKCILILF